MYNQVELWTEPRKDLYEKEPFICGMSTHDHAFLCGMIKKAKPKKIVEIGVADGGTTGVIMNALRIMGLESELFSVDLCERFYRDNTKVTGYEYERIKELIGGKSKQTFLLGKTIAAQIEKIGKGIDFVIIDTTHKLPGEVLDFLTVLPYLTDNATVILHDVNVNYLWGAYGKNYNLFLASRNAVATKILFSSVVADKYMVLEKDSLPNIAGFIVNRDTRKYLEALFYALTLTWVYMPSEEILNEYKTFFSTHYSDEFIKYFEIAICNNRRVLERESDMRELEVTIGYKFPYCNIPFGSKVAIYGAGLVGIEIKKLLSKLDIYNIVTWVDKRSEELLKVGKNVETPDKLLCYEFDYVVVAVESDSLYEEISGEIVANNWNQGKTIVGPIKRYTEKETFLKEQ